MTVAAEASGLRMTVEVHCVVAVAPGLPFAEAEVRCTAALAAVAAEVQAGFPAD